MAEKQGVWIMEKTLATPVIEDGLLTSVTLAHNGAGRVAHLAETIELAVRTDHDTTRGYALNNLAEVRWGPGRFEEGLVSMRDSLALKAFAEDVFGLAYSHASRADLHLVAGDPTAVRRDADEAVRLRFPARDPVENLGPSPLRPEPMWPLVIPHPGWRITSKPS